MPVNTTIPPDSAQNKMPSYGVAALLHRIVAQPECPAEIDLKRIPAPWKDIAEGLLNTPPDSTERNRAMETELSRFANASEIKAAIACSDINTPLTSFPEFKERFTLRSISEAFEPLEPLQFLASPIIPKGSVLILVGKPGCGKTWATFDLSICAAAGINFGSFAVTQTPVLIIDEESGLRRIKDRLKRVALGHAQGPELPLKFISLGHLNLNKDADVGAITRAIQETSAGLVIIDALADVMHGLNENDVKDVQPILMKLRKIAEETGATIITIHHENKSGEFRGSSAILGAVDIMLSIKADGNLIKFSSIKSRDTEPFTFQMDLNFEDDRVFLSESEAVAPVQVKISKPKRHVIEYLGAHGISKTSAITAAPAICTDNSARQAIFKLAQEQLVRRTDAGGPGIEAEYELTDSGQELYERLTS